MLLSAMDSKKDDVRSLASCSLVPEASGPVDSDVGCSVQCSGGGD